MRWTVYFASWRLCQLQKPMCCALTSELLMKGYDQVLPTNGPKPWTTIGPVGTHSAWSTILTRTSETGRTLCPLSKSLASATETIDCPPLKNAVKARTVEDALREIGQAHAQLGAPDPRKDSHGGIDFRIQRQISSYKKVDRPPHCVKPIPIIIILYSLAQAYDNHRSESDLAIADMIVIAFFFLLRPGEYTGTTSDDAPFRLEDVHLYMGGRNWTATLPPSQSWMPRPSCLTSSRHRRMASAMKNWSKVAAAADSVAP
jgi:hypothetical protein